MLLHQVDATAAIELTHQSGGVALMAPEPSAMRVVYTTPSWRENVSWRTDRCAQRRKSATRNRRPRRDTTVWCGRGDMLARVQLICWWLRCSDRQAQIVRHWPVKLDYQSVPTVLHELCIHCLCQDEDTRTLPLKSSPPAYSGHACHCPP